MTVITFLAVALAGAAGAVSRFLLDRAIVSRARGVMPWGTWTVNLSGSFALGALFVISERTGLSEPLRLALSAGFLGAFTTFSTWMYETMRLMEDRAWGIAAINIIGPVLAGPPAALLGAMIAGVFLI